MSYNTNQPTALVAPNGSDPQEIKAWMSTLCTFINNQMASGTQATFMTTAKLAEMVSNNDHSQAGKHFFNQETNKPMVSYISSGNLVIAPIATSFEERIMPQEVKNV